MNKNEKEVANAGEALKSVYTRLIANCLDEIGITDEAGHNLVTELLPHWKYLSETKKTEVGVTVAGKYNLAKFLFLMDQLSDRKEDETEQN